MTIDQSVKSRAAAKLELDALLLKKYNLTKETEKLSDTLKIERATVLTEGAVMNGSSPTDTRMYLTKGVLRDAVKRMEDRVYYLNIGHDTVSPLSIIGKFTKEDLTIATEKDGRSWLKADFKIDEDHVFVKELKRQGKPLSFSAEFFVTDEVLLELTAEELITLGYEAEESHYIRAVRKLDLDGFAVVVEPADVNAYQVTKLNNITMARIDLSPLEEAPNEIVAEEVAKLPVNVDAPIAPIEERKIVTAEITGDYTEEEMPVDEMVSAEQEVKGEEVETQLLSLKSRHESMSIEIENLKKENLELKISYEKLALEKKTELEKVQKTLSELLQKAEPILRDEVVDDRDPAQVAAVKKTTT